MKAKKIYTDGGCHGNPGPGAWAFRIVDAQGRVETEESGHETATTNNRMELTAVIRALRHVVATAESSSAESTWIVITDSQYVRQGITDWINRWRRNGWQTSAKKPVKNVELWKELDSLADRVNPQWAWVKGHAGNEHNEACDALVQVSIAEHNQA